MISCNTYLDGFGLHHISHVSVKETAHCEFKGRLLEFCLEPVCTGLTVIDPPQIARFIFLITRILRRIFALAMILQAPLQALTFERPP